MPISAVVDASVLVSAFLFPGSVPGRILKPADQGRFAMHLSPLLLDETRDALLSPRLKAAYRHDDEAVAAWCADLWEIGAVFLGLLPGIGQVCRDPNDDHVIAAALAVGAEFIVTGTRICWRLASTRPCASSRRGRFCRNSRQRAESAHCGMRP